ncbi:hypothetical protein GWI34_01495 [Actinomadura sp. DSM 109109]|nr:hypothetical protein [Actinomadura lepetitiana]
MSGNRDAQNAHTAAEAKSDAAHADLASAAKEVARGTGTQAQYDTARDKAADATQDVHAANRQLPYSQG